MSERTATFAEFARIAGFKRSYITQLRKDDRLMLDGARRVRVEASLDRIASSADPSKDGVRARHAVARIAETNAAEPARAPTAAAARTIPDPTAGHDRIGSTYQASRAVRERYLAMQAKIDYERDIGALLDAHEVVAAVAHAVTTLRARLESLPATLAARAASMTAEAEVNALLTSEIEHALEECARNFQTATEPKHDASAPSENH